MGIRQVFKISRKTFINPAGWLDFDFLKFQNQTIIDACKPLFKTPNEVEEETFENAMKRLGLTEADVKQGGETYHYYALFFLLLGFLTLFYSFYLLFRYFTIAGWIIGLATTSLFFVQAFKFDFWSYQMRNRKLGVTFNEWARSILGDKGTSK